MAPAGQAAGGSPFEVRLLRPDDDLAACGRLVAEVFAIEPAAVADWLAKRILDNPWQRELEAPGVVALKDGRIVAFRALFAQRWWIEGEERTLAWGANTCMPAALRGAGLGTRMVDAGGACAPITASSSSGLSTQPIYRKLGYVPVGTDNDVHDLRVSLRPSLAKRIGRVPAALLGGLLDALRPLPGRIPPGWRIEPFTTADARFDTLWRETRTGWPAARVRDAAALNERLVTHATQDLSRVALHDPGGRLRGFAIWHLHHHDAHVCDAVLRDAWTGREDATALEAMLGLLFREWRRAGVARALIEVANPLITPLLVRLGCTHRPSQGVRYQVLARPPLAAATLTGWFRSALDGDYLDLADPAIHP
jgi:GNAT superfamily N-acetyltransferase